MSSPDKAAGEDVHLAAAQAYIGLGDTLETDPTWIDAIWSDIPRPEDFRAAVDRAVELTEQRVRAEILAGSLDTREQVTIYAPNERLYGRCDACGQVKWDTDRYRGDGIGHATERGSHCGCCTHPHDLPPGGHTLRGEADFLLGITNCETPCPDCGQPVVVNADGARDKRHDHCGPLPHTGPVGGPYCQRCG